MPTLPIPPPATPTPDDTGIIPGAVTPGDIVPESVPTPGNAVIWAANKGFADAGVRPALPPIHLDLGVISPPAEINMTADAVGPGADDLLVINVSGTSVRAGWFIICPGFIENATIILSIDGDVLTLSPFSLLADPSGESVTFLETDLNEIVVADLLPDYDPAAGRDLLITGSVQTDSFTSLVSQIILVFPPSLTPAQDSRVRVEIKTWAPTNPLDYTLSLLVMEEASSGPVLFSDTIVLAEEVRYQPEAQLTLFQARPTGLGTPELGGGWEQVMSVVPVAFPTIFDSPTLESATINNATINGSTINNPGIGGPSIYDPTIFGTITGDFALDGFIAFNASVLTGGTWNSGYFQNGTLTACNLPGCTADGTNLVGYRGLPQNSQSAAYTLILADAGKQIYHPTADTTARTWTIPSNASVAFPIGTKIIFENDFGAGIITIAITTDTLVLAGAAGSTGSRTLAAGGRAEAIKVTSTRWRIASIVGLT